MKEFLPEKTIPSQCGRYKENEKLYEVILLGKKKRIRKLLLVSKYFLSGLPITLLALGEYPSQQLIPTINWNPNLFMKTIYKKSKQ